MTVEKRWRKESQKFLYFFKVITRGVRLAKNDFGSVLGSVLQKNCGLFGFGFTKLTVVLVFGSLFAQCVV